MADTKGSFFDRIYDPGAEPSKAFCYDRPNRPRLTGELRGTIEVPPVIECALGFVGAGPGLVRRVPEDDRFTVNGRDVSFEEFVAACRANGHDEAEISTLAIWMRKSPEETIPITLETPPPSAART